jgi:hypothetical protein
MIELKSLALPRLRRPTENDINKKTEKRRMRSDLRPEYDLSKLKGSVCGKYAARYGARTNLVLLSPDVAGHFPDDRAVNLALRRLIRSAKRPARRATPLGRNRPSA